jgi:hypothetical protein
MPSHGAVLPYRSDASELQHLIHALLRGQTRAEVRRSHFSAKTYEGVLATAHALALVDDRTGAVTAAGRRYALATPADRPALLRELLAAYPPFGEVLGAEADGERVTSLDRIVARWAAHGYGSSASNREEAAPAFAKLVEAARLGSYVQGRKGHPSRIEWKASKLDRPGSAADVGGENASRVAVQGGGNDAQVDATVGAVAAASLAAGANGRATDRNMLSWELAPGRRVALELPAALSVSERARLRRLLDVLLGE